MTTSSADLIRIDEKISVKTPLFDGDHTKWFMYETALESFGHQKKLTDIIELKPEDFDPEGTTDKQGSPLDAAQIAANDRLHDLNKLMCGIVVSSIKTNTEMGKTMYLKLMQTKEKNKYPNGNFPVWWKWMKKEFGTTKSVKSLVSLKQEFAEKKMGKTERPVIFITEMRLLWENIEKSGGTHGDDNNWIISPKLSSWIY